MICIANKFSVINIEQIKQGKEFIINKKIKNMIQNQQRPQNPTSSFSSFFGSSINDELLIECKFILIIIDFGALWIIIIMNMTFIFVK